MLRSVSIRGALLVGAATVSAIPAIAQDGGLQMVIGLSQRLETGSNFDLDVPADGTETISTTRLSFGLTAVTEISQLTFNASSALLIEDSFDTDGVETDIGNPDLSFGYTREVADAALEATARFRSDDVDAFDTSLSTDEEAGTLTEAAAGFRLETGRTASVGFEVGASYEEQDYEDTVDPDLVDNQTERANVAAILRFSEVMTGRLGLDYTHTEEDDDAQSITDDLTATAGLEYILSEGLTLAGSLGYADIEDEEFGVVENIRGPVGRLGFVYGMTNGTLNGELVLTRTADEDARTTFAIGRELVLPAGTFSARIGATQTDEAGTDLIGAVFWTQELPSGQIDLRVERSVSYDDDDDEVVVDSVAAVDWTMDVNALSSIGMDFSYAISDAPSERVEEAEFGATYNYSLTADWGLSSGVRYIVRDDLDGRAESPSVFMEISRDFDFLP
ncbi:hypothetical protein [Tabrizicola sp. BL-A-41-H6]|uniref:hypothetical protein n=1 Tax=Tabrizicola sp. BL-A-41-H6 TaxID=3421107 RepID=UPI003D66A1C0